MLQQIIVVLMLMIVVTCPLPQDKQTLSSVHPVGAQEDSSTTDIISRILDEIQSWQSIKKRPTNRPFITLTFAQSLDGKIALKAETSNETSSNLPLSGKESLLLTHGLRSIHDAILVGGTTLSIDNPRLSNRLWGKKQPRPVVLDTRLEHVRKLGSSRRAQNLIVCCSLEAAESFQEACHELFIELLPCQCDANGRLVLQDVLQRLKDVFRVESVMVEGGSSVHSAFLSEQLVDCLCVTIAPKILGNDRGLACFTSIGDSSLDYFDLASNAETSRFVPLGSDCIYICQLC